MGIFHVTLKRLSKKVAITYGLWFVMRLIPFPLFLQGRVYSAAVHIPGESIIFTIFAVVLVAVNHGLFKTTFGRIGLSEPVLKKNDWYLTITVLLLIITDIVFSFSGQLQLTSAVNRLGISLLTLLQGVAVSITLYSLILSRLFVLCSHRWHQALCVVGVAVAFVLPAVPPLFFYQGNVANHVMVDLILPFSFALSSGFIFLVTRSMWSAAIGYAVLKIIPLLVPYDVGPVLFIDPSVYIYVAIVAGYCALTCVIFKFSARLAQHKIRFAH